MGHDPGNVTSRSGARLFFGVASSWSVTVTVQVPRARWSEFDEVGLTAAAPGCPVVGRSSIVLRQTAADVARIAHVRRKKALRRRLRGEPAHWCAPAGSVTQGADCRRPSDSGRGSRRRGPPRPWCLSRGRTCLSTRPTRMAARFPSAGIRRLVLQTDTSRNRTRWRSRGMG